MSSSHRIVYTGSKARFAMPIVRWLPPHHIKVFVEPSEADEYFRRYPDADLVVLGKNDGGFGYMLNSMVQHALEIGQRHYMFSDDDVFGLTARESMNKKFHRIDGDLAASVLQKHMHLARDNRLAQLAVSFAGHSWGARRATDESIGAWGMFVADPAAAASVGGYDETLPIFNDWDLSAKLLLAGHRTARTNLLSFQHKMKSQPGGAQTIYDRAERVQQAAMELQARYGTEAVRVKHVAGHGLVEPRFNWKKLKRRTAA